MQTYSPKEIAAILNVAHGTVWRWIRDGKLKAARLGGNGTYRVTKEDLEAFMAK